MEIILYFFILQYIVVPKCRVVFGGQGVGHVQKMKWTYFFHINIIIFTVIKFYVDTIKMEIIKIENEYKEVPLL